MTNEPGSPAEKKKKGGLGWWVTVIPPVVGLMGGDKMPLIMKEPPPAVATVPGGIYRSDVPLVDAPNVKSPPLEVSEDRPPREQKTTVETPAIEVETITGKEVTVEKGQYIDHFAQALLDEQGVKDVLEKAGFKKGSEEWFRHWEHLTAAVRCGIGRTNNLNNPHLIYPDQVIQMLTKTEVKFILDSYLKDPTDPRWEIFAGTNQPFDPLSWAEAKGPILDLLTASGEVTWVTRPQRVVE